MQNLLNMTRLGSGALRPKRSVVDVRELIGTARADLKRPLQGHLIVIDIPADCSQIDVDPVLIGQALSNVLENAAKYAPAGSTIRIAARSDHAMVTLSVNDQGPGIPAAERSQEFDMFYRVDEGDRRPPARASALPSCEVSSKPMAVASAPLPVRTDMARPSSWTCRQPHERRTDIGH